MNKWVVATFLLFFALQANAFEDYIITTKGKLTDIQIENNKIVDICPLITVMNEKNTLIVHPLQEGITCFTVMKNDKEKFLFNIKITKEKTTILPIEGFEILAIDVPPLETQIDIDLPPNIDKIEFLENELDWLDPPKLREEVK